MRIVSLLPSNTEMVCALGLGDRLVGVSHECDFPAEAKGLPVLTASRIDSQQSQSEIHAQVVATTESGRSLYTVNEEILKELKPDLILTQGKCEVCAVSYDDVLSAVHRLWPKQPPQVLSFQPNSIWDIFGDMLQISAAAGEKLSGESAVKKWVNRVVEVQAKCAEIPMTERPGVVFLEWLDPLMSCGCWQPEMIELAGGRCLISRFGEKADWTTNEAIATALPDVLILGPCGMSLAQSRGSIRTLLSREWFCKLPAVAGRRTYVVDGNAYFNRPGPRLVDSLEMLSDIMTGADLSRWSADEIQLVSTTV